MRKTSVLMNKPIIAGQAILDKSKELMYEFWYDVMKPRYKDKSKLLYMDTDSFIMDIQTDDIFKDMNEMVHKWFNTSKYDKRLNRTIKHDVNKKIIGKFKDELNGMIMTEFIAIRPKVYAYRYIEDDVIKEEKRCKGTAKYIVKETINFETLKQTLFNDQTFLRKQERFRSDKLIMNTEVVNKEALSNKDNKRLRTFDGIIAYAKGMNVFKACESEMEIVLKNKHNNDKIKLCDNEKLSELREISIPLYY